jgi:opacity protein-like surface antigen
MNKLAVCASLLFFSLAGFAQQKAMQEKSFLTLRGGVSEPKGDFGNKVFTNPKAGLAEKGYLIAAEYGGFLNNYMGLGLTFGLRRNAIDIQAIRRGLLANINAETKWRTNFLLTNAYLKLPLGRKFYVYAKGGGGVTFNTYPQLSSGFNASTLVSEPKFTAQALAYGFGGGFKVLINNVGLGAEVYSLHTSPEFDIYGTRVKQEMNDISYSLNLSFKLK